MTVLAWEVGSVIILTFIAGLAGRHVLGWKSPIRFFLLLMSTDKAPHEVARSKHVEWMTKLPWLALLAALFMNFHAAESTAQPQTWQQEWTATDFTKHTVAFVEIRSGGPSKDGIPAIDSPRFDQLDAGRTNGWARNIADNEPVISLAIDGDARAYPVRILIWHEIVNDVVGGVPVVVTYCPLCNSGWFSSGRSPSTS